MKTLTGREIFSVVIDQTPLRTNPKRDGVEPRTYFRARHDGRGFTVDQAFLDAFNSGKIAEIYLSEGTYQRPDPYKAGEFITVDSWALSGFANRDQIKNMEQFNKEIDLIHNPVVDTVEINDDLIAKLQQALLTK